MGNHRTKFRLNIDQLMVMAPNFQPRRSGIVINNYFNCKEGGKDCNFNMINISNICNDCGGYIHSDILFNVDRCRYKDLVKECFGKIKDYWFPMEEVELQEVCNDLGIEMTTEPNCYVENSRDERFLNILADKNANIDELNYLMKRFDSFTTGEIEKFYAIAFAKEPKSMAELINLSFNLHCYSLINNFNDFNKLGKNLYLTEKMAVAAEELEKLDTLNKVSDKFMEMDGDVEYFERLVDYINHLTIDEFLLLADSMYEFELFDSIKDVEVMEDI